MNDSERTFTKAPLWRRLAAMVYDSLLVIALVMVTTAIYLGIKVALLGTDATLQNNQGYDPLLSSLLFIIIFSFFARFWTHSGQTLGMQVWHIRVQNSNGHPISLWQCLLRFMSSIPAILLCGIGLFWMLIDKEQRTWQDRFSLSDVVLIPK